MAVERLEIIANEFEGGRAFGEAGVLEELSGTARFAVDPAAAANKVITDLHLVPVDADGLVRFSATWRIIRPVDPDRRNRRLFLDLANRGGLRLWRNTNREGPPPLLSGADAVADGWVLSQGYCVASCGWQHDVPDREGMLRAILPEIRIDGAPVTGLVLCHIEPMRAAQTVPLGHVGHRPYPAVDLEEAGATLSIRRAADGPWMTIPRDRWRFGMQDYAGAFMPNAEHVTLDDGFEPGCAYELSYTGTGAVPTGLGLAGVRDFLSFLRYDKSSENPLVGQIDHAFAFGGSQPGNVLRSMEGQGLFRDVNGQPVIDGAIVHGAGIGKSEVNWRFGQPSLFAPRSVAYVGPFSEAIQREPDGTNAGSLLREPATTAAKMVYSITPCDYRDLFGALCHTELDGSADLDMPDNVRIYYMAGGPHLRSALEDDSLSALVTEPASSIDISVFLRAAVVNLDHWVTTGTPCPPSRYPTLQAGTLVPASVAITKAEAATGQAAPPMVSLGRLDFGPRMGQHIVDHAPIERTPYAMLACDVDRDGNDIDGLRHPEITVPLATYLPWNIARTSTEGHRHGMTLIGSMVPFGITTGDGKRDSRPPIAARYADRETYLEAIRCAANALIADRFILAEDEALVVDAAAARYDRIVGNVSDVAPVAPAAAGELKPSSF